MTTHTNSSTGHPLLRPVGATGGGVVLEAPNSLDEHAHPPLRVSPAAAVSSQVPGGGAPIPLQILIGLCTNCDHGNNCVEPLIRNSAGGGLTCLAYSPVKGESLRPDHIMALPDREPCADCACRKGTIPNGTPHSMAEFSAAVDRLEPFFCHDSGANRVCAGWLRAAKARIKNDD